MYNVSKSQASILRQHRERVRAAKPRIDTNPPMLDVQNMVRFRRLHDDVGILRHTEEENYQLVKDIMHIIRGKGAVDSFPEKNNMQPTMNKVWERVAANNQLREENFVLQNRLITVKAAITTRRSAHSFHMRRKRPRRMRAPYALLSKYSSLKLPEDEAELNRLLRPCVYFDLELKGLRPLGRVIIQLYTEASPLVVLEFIRICTERKHELIRFVRLFPSLWLEGELKVNAKNAVNFQHEYDMRALDNNSGPGILSYSKSYTKVFKPGLFNFSISFKPLSVVNGSRVAFGRVVSGMSVLTCIEDNGTKKGRPIKEVAVTKCGLLSKKQTATQRKSPLKYVRRTSAEMQQMSDNQIKKSRMTKRSIK